MEHVQQRSVSSIPENILIEVPLDGTILCDPDQIDTRTPAPPSVRLAQDLNRRFHYSGNHKQPFPAFSIC